MLVKFELKGPVEAGFGNPEKSPRPTDSHSLRIKRHQISCGSQEWAYILFL
jgi:hypothetical protein